MSIQTTSLGTWEPLLRTPEPRDHLVQLYTDEIFLCRAVAQFIGPALAQGEGAVIIAIPEHVEAFARTLSATIDVAAARARDQLLFLDAETSLAQFMVDGQPDRAAFFSLVNGALDRLRRGGHDRVRAFGEMVNLLWRDDLAATMALETLWNEALADGRVSLLCAYRIDNFDREVHRGILHRISRCHSHFIPVDDYDRLEQAVDRAYKDVFGAFGDPQGLREMLSTRYQSATAMPRAQAALHAVRELTPTIADDVLARARRYYRGDGHPSSRRG